MYVLGNAAAFSFSLLLFMRLKWCGFCILLMQMWTPTRRKHYEIAPRSILFLFRPKSNSSQFTSRSVFSALFFLYLFNLPIPTACTTDSHVRVHACIQQCFLFYFLRDSTRSPLRLLSTAPQSVLQLCARARSCTVPLAGSVLVGAGWVCVGREGGVQKGVIPQMNFSSHLALH